MSLTAIPSAIVLTDKELDHLSLNEKEREIYIKKWIKGKDVKKWVIKSQESWLIYFKAIPSEKSPIYQHLVKFREILENRAEIKRNSKRNWLELAWPRDKKIFETKPKILIPYKSRLPFVAIDEGDHYTSADFRIISVKKPYNIYVLAGIMNSNLITWFLKKSTKKLGAINDYYSYNLREIPINRLKKRVSFKIYRKFGKKNNNKRKRKNIESKYAKKREG